MQNIEKVKKLNKILVALLILCVCIILVLAGIILRSVNPKEFTREGELISVKTPCCALKYPAEYSKLLKCIDKNEDDVYSKVFYGCVDSREIELFEVSFGVKENATLIGYITHGDESHPVFVRSMEISSDLSQDSQNTLFTMQEGINTVIQSITSDKNYTESK